MTIHDLKTWPEPFAAVLDGRKTYEIRVDDRGFKVGDRLRLKEWDRRPYDVGFCRRSPLCSRMLDHGGRCDSDSHADYTGREILVDVTYLTLGGAWGLPAGLCVLAIRKVEHVKETP